MVAAVPSGATLCYDWQDFRSRGDACAARESSVNAHGIFSFLAVSPLGRKTQARFLFLSHSEKCLTGYPHAIIFINMERSKETRFVTSFHM